MRTKKPPVEKPQPIGNTDVAPVAPEVVEDISRLSFAVDSDGNILWDRMREKTQNQLKAILASPETARKLGVDSPAPAQVEVFDPEWTGSVLDSFGKLEAFLAGKMYKIDSDIAEKVFTYTDKEKEKFSQPLAKVINKYAATWMVTFKDEIALAFLFVTVTAVKLQIATTMQNQRVKPASAPQPIRTVSVPSASDLDAVEAEREVKEATAN